MSASWPVAGFWFWTSPPSISNDLCQPVKLEIWETHEGTLLTMDFYLRTVSWLKGKGLSPHRSLELHWTVESDIRVWGKFNAWSIWGRASEKSADHRTEPPKVRLLRNVPASPWLRVGLHLHRAIYHTRLTTKWLLYGWQQNRNTADGALQEDVSILRTFINLIATTGIKGTAFRSTALH